MNLQIKFSLFPLLLAVANATHFRAGSLQFKKDENGVLTVTRTMGWRRTYAGFGDSGCDDNDMNKMSGEIGAWPTGQHRNYYLPIGETSDPPSNEISGTSHKKVTYKLLQIEQSSSLHPNNDHFCFGKTIDEALPAVLNGQSFTMTNGYRSEGDTVTLTHDNGNSAQSYYQYTAHVYQYDNNSPQFESPAIWWIMSGCQGQTYYLTPQDPDGDEIVCRWSTMYEASFLAHDKEGFDVDGETNWPLNQLSLDATACAVTYHPEYDSNGGNKPIGVQVEDFDANGDIKSSVPSVFLAKVFTPGMDESILDNPYTVINRRKRHAEDDDTHQDGEQRAWTERPNLSFLTRNTDHCDGLPVWVDPTPPNESLLIYEATVAYYQVWAARFLFNGVYYTTVTRAQFSLPDGMTCSELREDGTATCFWTPTVEQIGLHTVCGLCYDVFKRPSNRNCVKIEVIHKQPPIEDPCNTTTIEGMKRYFFDGQDMQEDS